MLRLAAITLIGFAAFAQTPARLIARWRSLEKPHSGTGAIFEFHKDGTLLYSPGSVDEMKYRIEGNRLVMPADKDNGPHTSTKMEWVSADRVIFDSSQTLSRVGRAPDPKNPLLGEWTAPLERAGVRYDVRWFFNADGKMLLLSAYRWQKGQYSVKGATICIALPEIPELEGALRIEGDVLTMPSPHRTGASHFRRY